MVKKGNALVIFVLETFFFAKFLFKMDIETCSTSWSLLDSSGSVADYSYHSGQVPTTMEYD
jgi:hypothetical protein